MHFNFLLNYLHNTHLSITVYAVRRPAARLHLIGVQAPEFELLLEQRSAHIGRIVQLSGSVGKNKKRREIRNRCLLSVYAVGGRLLYL